MLPQPGAQRRSLVSRIKRKAASLLRISPLAISPQYERVRVPPNGVDAQFLERHLDVYYEFPPVFRTENTRWGDAWTDAVYPTPAPLLNRVTHPAHQVYLDEATSYTWICYAKLK